MYTITLSPSAYAQAEAYARCHNLSVGEVVERGLSALASRKRTCRKAKADNPSPSGDAWFDDAANMAHFREAVAASKHAQGREVTLEEVDALLGL